MRASYLTDNFGQRLWRNRWVWGRWLVIALVCLGVGVGLATWYGYWLSTDRLDWAGPADGVVSLSGYKQNEHAAEWLSRSQVREIWVIRMRASLLVKMGIHEDFADSSLRELHQLGVPDSQVRVVSIDAEESNLPRLLQGIGTATEQPATTQVIVACHPLYPRFLRQIADCALPPEQAERLRFVSLPHDEYVATRWWMSRAGWKDTYGTTMQLIANACFGATSGFEPAPWSPDEWEAQTFPALQPVSP